MAEFRKNLGRIKKILDIPNLLDIQTKSYEKFLQWEVDPAARANVGLQGAFKSVFPISDFSGKCSLEFVSYKIGEPRYDVKECLQKGMTYAAPLKIVARLVVFDTERTPEQRKGPSESRPIRDIKEQEIFFGEIPLMTDTGTFIVNGTERVIVSQLHRSPGIFYDHDKGKNGNERQTHLLCPDHSYPWLLVGFGIRFQRPPLCEDRPTAQNARHDPPEGDGQFY